MSESLSLRELLRDRTVGLLLSVELLTTLGFGATATALGWQAYSRVHEPIVLGLLGLAEFIPAALLAIPAGHVADRNDRRRVAALGLAVVTLTCAGLAVDAAAGDTKVWPLYAFAFLSGVGNAYAGPAITPLLAAGVSQRSFARAVAVLISVMQVAMIAGPAVAGLLQIISSPAPYIFAGLCAAAAAVMVSIVPAAIGRAHVGEHKATFSDALAGARFIFATPALLGAISLDLVAVLFGGATALLPIFSPDGAARRRARQRPAAGGPGNRRGRGRHGALGPAAEAARRPHPADRGRGVWRVHRGVRAIDELRAVDGGARRFGRRRHGRVSIRATLCRCSPPPRCGAGWARSSACSSAPPTSSARSSRASPPRSSVRCPRCCSAGSPRSRWQASGRGFPALRASTGSRNRADRTRASALAGQAVAVRGRARAFRPPGIAPPHPRPAQHRGPHAHA